MWETCSADDLSGLQTDVANKTQELGGILRFDLTPDVTHLLVGDYDTPKYRHVAKDRPDIKLMDPRWVDAVRELWVVDEPFSVKDLEAAWHLRPLECKGCPPGTPPTEPRGRVLCSVTGFNDCACGAAPSRGAFRRS